MCNFSTYNRDGFFHSCLNCLLFSSKKHTRRRIIGTAQFNVSMNLCCPVPPLTTTSDSSCRQRCSYPGAVGQLWPVSLCYQSCQVEVSAGSKTGYFKTIKKPYCCHLVYTVCLLLCIFRVLVKQPYQRKQNYRVNFCEFATIRSHFVFFALMEGQT